VRKNTSISSFILKLQLTKKEHSNFVKKVTNFNQDFEADNNAHANVNNGDNAGQNIVSGNTTTAVQTAVDGQNGLDLLDTVLNNLLEAPAGLVKNIDAYSTIGDRFSPEMVISDFESWAFMYALNHGLPLVSIDNMQILNRCEHTPEVLGSKGLSYWIAKTAVKIKLPRAYHYLITSFFFPRVRKHRTSLGSIW